MGVRKFQEGGVYLLLGFLLSELIPDPKFLNC
jgi:hypothetical protein